MECLESLSKGVIPLSFLLVSVGGCENEEDTKVSVFYYFWVTVGLPHPILHHAFVGAKFSYHTKVGAKFSVSCYFVPFGSDFN